MTDPCELAGESAFVARPPHVANRSNDMLGQTWDGRRVHAQTQVFRAQTRNFLVPSPTRKSDGIKYRRGPLMR